LRTFERQKEQSSDAAYRLSLQSGGSSSSSSAQETDELENGEIASDAARPAPVAIAARTGPCRSSRIGQTTPGVQRIPAPSSVAVARVFL